MMLSTRAHAPAGLAALLAASLGLATAAHADPTFTTLDNAADPTFNQLLAINNAGTIAGYFGSGAAGHPNKGYTLVPPYGQANYTNENFPGSVQTQVTGINNTGQTVGFWADAAGNNFGWVNSNGVFTNVVNPNTPTTGTMTDQLLGVNDKNQAAGFYVDANGVSHGFVYDIATKSFTAINVAGATNVTATDINNSGLVSGFFTDAAGNTLGFLENINGTGLKTFSALGSKNTMFLGLNNMGQEAGTYTDANGIMHGMLFSTATQAVLTLDAPKGVGTTTINGLNDVGQAVGFYVDGADLTHGLLVTAVPEPASMALLGLGMAAVVVPALRRRAGRAGGGAGA